jgi:phospholipid/cholesterol/gamma-HCH transport system permease protein
VEGPQENTTEAKLAPRSVLGRIGAFWRNVCDAVGSPLVELYLSLRSILALSGECLKLIFFHKKQWKIVFRQMYWVGNKSIIFIMVTMAFLSMVSIYQTATQISRILPDFSLLGAGFIQIMVKQFAPVMTALMIATKVGTGIAAEIGTMAVTEQVDALKMSNTDPVRYLLVPRVIACTVMVPVLSVFATGVAILTGMITANIGFEVQYDSFWDLQWLTWAEMGLGLCKAFSFGFLIPIISAHAGFQAYGGSEGVGTATTRAVVNSSFAVIVLDFVWSTIGFTML